MAMIKFLVFFYNLQRIQAPLCQNDSLFLWFASSCLLYLSLIFQKDTLKGKDKKRLGLTSLRFHICVSSLSFLFLLLLLPATIPPVPSGHIGTT